MHLPSEIVNNRNRTKRKSRGTSRIYHKWTALVISIFLLLFALSGIVLNHRSFFSPVDVDRKWLPSVYKYDNWNLAGVKSSIKISENSVLVYGNIGIWLTDSSYTSFTDYSHGFPKGIDNRKIFTMSMTGRGHVYAGSLSGLYLLNRETEVWKYVKLPAKEKRVVGITQKGDSLYVMTRSDIHVSSDTDIPVFTPRTLPPAEVDTGTVTLFSTLWVIHSGKIYGLAGKLIVDAMASILILLIISGSVYWFTPGLLKRISGNKIKSGIKRTNRSGRVPGRLLLRNLQMGT